MATIVISGVKFSNTPAVKQHLTIKYRKKTDPDTFTSYIPVTADAEVNIDGSLVDSISIEGLLSNTTYVLAVYSNCNGKVTYKDVFVEDEVSYIWVDDVYVCEQDGLFSTVATITGFSSPQQIFYNEDNQKVYVVDADDINGNFMWFNPNSMSSYADATHLPASYTIYLAVHDKERSKIYAVGSNTNGMLVFDTLTNTISTTVLFGTNGAFSRNLLTLQGDYIYSSYTDHLVVIDANTLTKISDVAVASIPLGSANLTNGFNLNSIQGNIWASAGAGRPGKDIVVYDSTITNVVATIPLPTSTVPGWGSSRYWGSLFYDEEKNKVYYHDLGTSTTFVIDGTTRSFVETIAFENRDGKNYATMGYQIDPNSNKLYGSYEQFDTPSVSTDKRTYEVNRTTYNFNYMFEDIYLGSFAYQTGTNILWGNNRGLASWEGGSWSTDGTITKLTY